MQEMAKNPRKMRAFKHQLVYWG